MVISFLELRPRVVDRVVVVLDRHGGKLLSGRAVAVHVQPGDHRVQRGERGAHEAFPFPVGRRGQRVYGDARLDVGHLLDARGDDDVVVARGHRHDGGAERQAARGTGGLDAGRRDVLLLGQADEVGDERASVLLVDEHAAAHVAHVHGLDLLAAQLRVLDGLDACLDHDVTERAVPHFAELGAARTDDCYVSHVQSPALIFFLCRA